MRVLADTPIWSAALRRDAAVSSPYRAELERLIHAGLAELIGPIRQEVLSGIRDAAVAVRVRDKLRLFPDLPAQTQDHELAAEYYNLCRSKGIQGSATDFLICALSVRHQLAIFTDDRDFEHYAQVLPIRLYRMTG